ncbi:methyl-accepting chemotaxis protein [Trichocoleus sp. FACHB-262]|uniref:methyl-accepting chemotaxis protein n=1 Tax=Trichocoleus sp. FACHB-262 TaxID=2692869 RepID=UPI001A7EDBCA|nr:methyl-accepting chemotaxis protein [Trichocoleus sp. FACHB-262]
MIIQMVRTAEQINPAAGEHKSVTLQLTQVAARQTAELAQTLNAVERITQSVQAVAVNAQQANEISTSTGLQGTAIDKTVKRLLKLRETVAHTAKKVQQLDESSQKISQVVSLIHQIALQTSSLSINPPLETAPPQAGVLELHPASIELDIESMNLMKGVQIEDAQRSSIEQILEASHQVDQLMQTIAKATLSHAQTAQAVAQLLQAITLAPKPHPETAQIASGSLPPFSSPMNCWQNL